MKDCIFCKIANNVIDVDKVYENKDKRLIGELFIAAKKIAYKNKISDSGYRLIFNCNENGGQTVFHIHLHMLAKRKMSWPPG